MEPATYTLGELRDLAEKLYVGFVIARNDTNKDRLDAECAIDAAKTFAQAWGERVKVKP